MKKILLLATILISAGLYNASADMLLYTFEGTIIFNNSPLEPKININDPVTYQFLIDTDLPGSVIDNAGNLVTFSTGTTVKQDAGTTKTTNYNYFFAEFAGKGVLPDLTVGDISKSSMGMVENYTTTSTITGNSVTGAKVSLIGGQFGHMIILSNVATSIDSWTVGSLIDGLEISQRKKIVNGTTTYETVVAASDLRLASIQSVSEPSTVILLVSGWVMFFAALTLRRRRNTTNQAIDSNYRYFF